MPGTTIGTRVGRGAAKKGKQRALLLWSLKSYVGERAQPRDHTSTVIPNCDRCTKTVKQDHKIS